MRVRLLLLPVALRPRRGFPGLRPARRRVVLGPSDRGRCRSSSTAVLAVDPSLIDLVETRAGDNLSMAAVRASIAHLYSLARFQDVQVDAVSAAHGAVDLRYNLIAVRAADRVEFRGSLGLSESLLRDIVTERFGRTPPPGRAQEVARALEKLYEDRGYFRVLDPARFRRAAPA